MPGGISGYGWQAIKKVFWAKGVPHSSFYSLIWDFKRAKGDVLFFTIYSHSLKMPGGISGYGWQAIKKVFWAKGL
jgi:hypothetical protein